MASGSIRALKDKYGFIKQDAGDDCFFLPTAMQKTPGIRFEDLVIGQRVEFTVVDNGDKGLRAVDILVVDE